MTAALPPALQELAKTIGVEIVRMVLAGHRVREVTLGDVVTAGTASALARLEANVAAEKAFGPRPRRR